MELLTPDHVQAVLDRHVPGTVIRFFDTTTATSQQAADNIGCELAQILKSICFIADGSPIVVLTSGVNRVDDKKIAALLGISRKQIKIASPDDCVNFYGYAPGSVPPFGYRTPDVRAFIDETLQQFDVIYAAGGAHNAIFPITLAQVMAITGAALADVKKD